MCYNQEAYIEEALRAALAQTYEPLEVIVSDDCSTDGSWAIIQRVVAAYQGPHKIVLNRNERNLKTIGNFQKLCSLASGELIVKADGDDVSYPQRAEVLVKDWVASGCRALITCSSYDLIDPAGHALGEMVFPNDWETRSLEQLSRAHIGEDYIGCSMMLHKSLYARFPYPEFQCLDDHLYALRALVFMEREFQTHGTFSQRLRHCSEKLVRYRKFSGTTSQGRWHDFMIRNLTHDMRALQQAEKDIAAVACAETSRLKPVFQSRIAHFKGVLAFFQARTFSARRAYFRFVKDGNLKHKFMVYAMLFAPTCADYLLHLMFQLTWRLKRTKARE